jgi:hypothetical protein
VKVIKAKTGMRRDLVDENGSFGGSTEIYPGKHLEDEENSNVVRNLFQLVVETCRNDRAAKPIAEILFGTQTFESQVRTSTVVDNDFS